MNDRAFVDWQELRTELERDASVEDLEQVERFRQQLVARVRGERLRELRLASKLTQRQLAKRLGVTAGRISQIESGDASGFDVLARYVAALGGRLELVAEVDGVRTPL